MTREEAIGKVRCELSGLPFDKDVREAFETLIPELKESEDGRIIRTLQEYVKNRNWNLGGPTQDEVLAWLENQKQSFRQIHDSVMWDSGLKTGIELGKKERKPKFSVGEKIRYCGTEYEITGIEGVSDGYMYNVLDISPNPDNNSLYRVHSSREPRMEKIAEQKPEVKTGDDETEAQKEGDDRSFILDLLEEQLRHCKKNQEGARRSRRIRSAMDWVKSAHTEKAVDEEDEKVRKWLLGYFYLHSDVLRGASVTPGEVLSFLGNHPGKGEEDIDESEFNPKPGEKFWVRCKTEKSENLWFDKDDERPAYAVTDPSGIITYIVHIKKDGTGNCVSYQDKEKFLEVFDILESKR